MGQPQRWQSRYSRSQQQLLDWIDDIPTEDSERRFEWIKTLTFRPQELDLATDHAFHLYTKWLSEDLRRLWSLFGSRSGPQALMALWKANDALWKLPRDRQNADAHAFVIIPRLCQARWDMRENRSIA
jgi:hypothetical protein